MKDKQTLRRELEEYTKDWRALIEVLSYPVSVHDTEFNIVLANKAAYDVCGKVGDAEERKCYQVFHRADRHIDDCPMVKTLKTGRPQRSEVYEPSVEKFFVIVTAPIIKEEKIIGILHSVTDITSLKKTEESHTELTEVYADTITKLKIREVDLQKSRDAFFNMLDDITESYEDLKDLFIKLITTMVNVLDAKSPWTKGHSENVAKYSEQIAKEIGLDDDETNNLRLAGLLHDIGKIGTYDYLLEKDSDLTEEEYKIVKKHPEQGVKILEGIKQLKDIIPLIKYHHERVDGKGYPEGLKGEEIPLGSRIIHVADSFDSMTANRPYRSAPGIKYALAELRKRSGSQFDPEVFEVFLRILRKEHKIP